MRREPAQIGRPAAGGEHDRCRVQVVDADNAIALDAKLASRHASDVDTRARARNQQCGDEATGIDLVVTLDQQAAANGGREVRLELSAFAGRRSVAS